MQKISAINPETATGKSKELFTAVHNKFGMVPNMMRTMGHSPAVLSGYLAFNGALGESSLGAKLGEQIAITVANANGCGYCNAAHSFIGEKIVGMDNKTIEESKEGKAADLKTQAALSFSKALITKKGMVSDTEIESLKKAGFTDAAITEIIAYTGFNIFTNYFNNALKVALDFPEAALIETAVI
jgi:uncharacterized peroxidase-related enzyme